VNESTFNNLTEQHGGNVYWKKYESIHNVYERVVIYDKESRQMYNSDYQDFIPLIQGQKS